MSQLQQINDFLTHGISWKPLSWNENYENTIILIDNSEEYFLAWPEKLLFILHDMILSYGTSEHFLTWKFTFSGMIYEYDL